MNPSIRPASYVEMRLPVVIRKIGAAIATLPPEAVGIYEQVLPDANEVGATWPGLLEHLACHGAFVCADAPPLLSRVLLAFALPGYGEVQAIGWTLWRRTANVEISSDNGRVVLPRGFGVLFEWLPDGARRAIEEILRQG